MAHSVARENIPQLAVQQPAYDAASIDSDGCPTIVESVLLALDSQSFFWDQMRRTH